jgi:5-methyltetrahydrofolate--homocysteine methyltransferase
MSSIHEAITKTYSSLMELWEPCCNVLILLEEDFRGERFKDFPHSLKGNNDLLSLTQPQAIKDVHAAYFAGADIVETTFSGTTIGMADYHLEEYVYELNYESAKLAREVADEFTTKIRQTFCSGFHWSYK